MAAYSDPLFKKGMEITMTPNTALEYVIQQYSDFVGETAIFKADRGIQYCVTKMNGEVGELLDKLADMIKYDLNSEFMQFPENAQLDLILELGDVCWYSVALLRELGFDFRNFSLDAVSGPLLTNNFIHTSMLVAGRAGAISERSGKIIRDKDGDGTNTSYLAHEAFVLSTIKDLLLMLRLLDILAEQFDSSLTYVISRNVEKLKSRKDRGTLRGSGDHR